MAQSEFGSMPYKEENQESKAFTETSGSMPYKEPSAESIPLNGIGEQKTMPELRGWEADFAAGYPNSYAALKTFTESIAPFAAMPYTIPLIYAKYLFPSNRDEFMQLDQQDQTRTLLWDSLAVAAMAREKELMAVGGMVWRGMVKKPMVAVGRVLGVATKEAKVVPFEDAVKGLEGLLAKEKFAPFSYEEEVQRRLVDRGFGKREAAAVGRVLGGADEGALLDAIVEKKYVGRELTKPFKESIEWQTGRTYPMPKLKPGMVEEFGEDVLRAKYYTKQFEEVLTTEVYRAKAAPRTVENIFAAHVRRLFPEAEGLGFGEITPHQMTNVLLDMMENKSISWQAAHPTLMASLHPARVVFGIGETALGTLKNIYEPIKAALGRTNRNYFNHSLLFAKMLEQRGAYESVVVKESGEFAIKRAKWLTPKVMDEANAVALKMDELAQKALGASKGEATELAAESAKLGQGMSFGAKVLVDTWRTFSDHLYGEHVKMQLPRLFRKAGMTELGQVQINRMMDGPGGLNYAVDELFSTVSNKNTVEKIKGMKEILKRTQSRLEYVGEAHPYFKAQGPQLAETIAGLQKELGWTEKGFLKYLDNYVARVSQHESNMVTKWRETIGGQYEAAFAKTRTLEKLKGQPVSFGEMIQARTLAHAKEHFFYDKLGEVFKFAEGLPPAWTEYTESYLTGILGRPTVGDYKLAAAFTKTVGGFSRALKDLTGGRVGGEGLWDEQRVIQLAYGINNLVYLGALGFKPFSAARNMFQPLLTVPADLGGLKDLGKLVSGHKWALNPKNQAYLRDIGAIAEYAPEIYLRPPILRQGKTLGGVELPTLDATRDIGLWMFRGSDRYSRYVTGGAAVQKFEGVAEKFGGEQQIENISKNYKLFSQKLNLGSRRDWARAEMEDLLARGKVSEAKAYFVNDVIADTQYLYGAADAPVVVRKYGAVGRTAFVFQSWWMNYGSLLHKWLTTGQSPGAVFERMATGMVSQSMGYMLMEPIWGKGTAVGTTFLGPFPREFNEFLLPPSWAPLYHATAAIMNVQRPEISAKHAKAVLDTSIIFAPGGLQAKSFYRGAKEEGWEGFGKAFLRLK